MSVTAYNEYRKSAKKTSYRSDLLSLHKGWLAFGVEQDSFCERDTSPENASVENVGMASLLSSKLYGSRPGKRNFIGFSATLPTNTNEQCGTVNSINLYTTTVSDEKIRENDIITGAGCVLGITEYKMGVFGHLSGEDYIPTEVDNNGVVDENTTISAQNPPAGSIVCT